MKDHYNLYYLFLEDKEKNPLPMQQSEAIRKNIEKFFGDIKPPWKSLPLISGEGKTLTNKSILKEKTIMKKLLCMALALIMVLSLCACGQEKPNNDNNANNQTNQNDQGNTEQNGNEPSDEEGQMMGQYKTLAALLKSYVAYGRISYDNGEVSLEGAEALEAIYNELSDMEELDAWYGSDWMPVDDPETNWNRTALLNGFKVVENVLLKQDCTLTDRVGENEEYKNSFVWSYNADSTVNSVRWNAKLFHNFIPYVFGLETEAFYDVVQRKGTKTEGADFVYDETGILTQIKILGEVDDDGDEYDDGKTGTEILFTLKYDTDGKLIGADWARYKEYSGNIKFAYDANGNLAQAVSEIWNDDRFDDRYIYSYGYDAEGNLKEISHKPEWEDGEQRGDIITYTFTKNSATETSGTVAIYGGAFCYYNKDKQKDQTNRDVTFTYDAQGRLIKAEQGAGALYSSKMDDVTPYNKAVFEYVYSDMYTYTPAE